MSEGLTTDVMPAAMTTEPSRSQVPFHVARIDHVVLRCRDLEAMLAFYCGVLGLEVAKRNARAGLIHLRAGSAMIDLVAETDPHAGPAPDPERRNMDHFCLRIDPFDPIRLGAYLRSRGITPGEARKRFGAEGDGVSLYVCDPEGNRVELKGASESVRPNEAPGGI